MEQTNEEQKDFRCGMVSIVGRPNVGKSTLINRILGEKVAIVSKVPQTTRNQVRGIYNDERGQIIFIDTPGLHLGGDKLDRFMNRASAGSMEDMDCIIHLVDSSEPTGEEEHNVVEHLKKARCPIVLGLNKVDLKGKYIPEYITLWEQIKGKPVTELKNFVLLPLSGKDGIHIEKLIDILFECLPTGPALYPEDIICDVPKKMVVSDIVREKFLHIMREEVPHSIAVVIEEMRPKKGKIFYIRALVLVQRESQKEIVIGQGGKILKKVGSLARAELEELLGSKVYLEIVVRAQKNWRDDPSILLEMGYSF